MVGVVVACSSAVVVVVVPLLLLDFFKYFFNAQSKWRGTHGLMNKWEVGRDGCTTKRQTDTDKQTDRQRMGEERKKRRRQTEILSPGPALYDLNGTINVASLRTLQNTSLLHSSIERFCLILIIETRREVENCT